VQSRPHTLGARWGYHRDCQSHLPMTLIQDNRATFQRANHMLVKPGARQMHGQDFDVHSNDLQLCLDCVAYVALAIM